MGSFTGLRTAMLISTNKAIGDARAPMGNRAQIVLFTLLTLILTAVSVWAARAWLGYPTTVTFVVGPEGGVEAKFAARLAAVVADNSRNLRVSVVSTQDAAQALTRLGRGQFDLAMLRTDAKVPNHARAVAILEHEVLLMLGPKGSKVKALADLRGKKVAVIGADSRSEGFFRHLLELYDISTNGMVIETLPPGTILDKLLAPGGYNAVIAIEPLSKISADKRYEELAKRLNRFTLEPIDEAKAIERKSPGTFAESIDAGLLSAAPRIPDDDLDTIGLQWILVARDKLSEATVTDLARLIFENKADLAIDNQFATKIEPADTDKDAFIVAHQGAAQYINDDTKTFLDRYSDILYLTMGCGSIIASIFVGLYSAVTRIRPTRAIELSTAVIEVGERIDDAASIEALEAIQDELEGILKRVLVGLKDGSVSDDGLDAFRLAYELVRDSLDMRVQSLTRRADRKGAAIAGNAGQASAPA
ncbi:TRAP transporter solute receptor, TAXI family [Rhizobiales bacterium GAS188]|nr:TRAP transporter solute receptor, TAXI family [Rhizobiales bacterium GAS188]